MRQRMERLYPVLRSITGDGVRETLAVLAETVPLRAGRGCPSGTQVYDWTINDEWNVREAYIADATGRRLVDVRDHNLHLVSYSMPGPRHVHARRAAAAPAHAARPPRLDPLPDQLLRRNWGFCLTQRQLDALGDGPFDVVVDTTLAPGELNYGELFIPGDTEEEVARHLARVPPLPGQRQPDRAHRRGRAGRGARGRPRAATLPVPLRAGHHRLLTWLSRNPEVLPRIRHGLVLTGLGGGGPLVYKRTRTRRPGHRPGRATSSPSRGEVRGYSPYGYDERQFNAVGFDLPFGRLPRTPHGEYPEYHTSADDLGFVTDVELEESLAALTGSSTSSSTTRPTSTSARTASRSWVRGGCIRRWAGRPPPTR